MMCLQFDTTCAPAPPEGVGRLPAAIQCDLFGEGEAQHIVTSQPATSPEDALPSGHEPRTHGFQIAFAEPTTRLDRSPAGSSGAGTYPVCLHSGSYDSLTAALRNTSCAYCPPHSPLARSSHLQG